jgi:hypothetical protein
VASWTVIKESRLPLRLVGAVGSLDDIILPVIVVPGDRVIAQLIGYSGVIDVSDIGTIKPESPTEISVGIVEIRIGIRTGVRNVIRRDSVEGGIMGAAGILRGPPVKYKGLSSSLLVSRFN